MKFYLFCDLVYFVNKFFKFRIWAFTQKLESFLFERNKIEKHSVGLTKFLKNRAVRFWNFVRHLTRGAESNYRKIFGYTYGVFWQPRYVSSEPSLQSRFPSQSKSTLIHCPEKHWNSDFLQNMAKHGSQSFSFMQSHYTFGTFRVKLVSNRFMCLGLIHFGKLYVLFFRVVWGRVSRWLENIL